jgi:hypothetical protein
LTKKRFQEHSRVGMSTVRRHFSTWREALDKAGLGHLYNYAKPLTEKMRAQQGRGLSDEQLIITIQEVAHRLAKETLTRDEFDQHAPISAATPSKRFGGWAKALHKAGLAPLPVQRRYTDEECFENLLAVWTHYGRPPKYEEMPLPPSTISVRAYTGRWGSWRKALHAFVDYANSNESSESDGRQPVAEESSSPVRQAAVAEPRASDADQRQVKLGLRYKVLKRDRFRCVLCGRNPAMTPGLELHVDHIVPWSHGGKTVLENLRSTCRDCNIGKGATV